MRNSGVKACSSLRRLFCTAKGFGLIPGQLLEAGHQQGDPAQAGLHQLGALLDVGELLLEQALPQHAVLHRAGQQIAGAVNEAGGGDADADGGVDLVGDAGGELKQALVELHLGLLAPQLLEAQLVLHSGQHLELVERLGYIVAAAGLKGLLERPDPAVGADEEYRQAPLARQLLDAAARLVTVHHRHVDVHQHQIGGELGGGIHRLQAVGGLPHPVTRLFQQTAQDVAVGCHVIDDQDFTHLYALSCPREPLPAGGLLLSIVGRSLWRVAGMRPLPASVRILAAGYAQAHKTKQANVI